MKIQEIRKKSEEEIQQDIVSTQNNLQRLKFAHSISPLDNPMQIREERRHLARLKTELQARKKQAQEA